MSIENVEGSRLSDTLDAEQAQVVQLLVERVDVTEGGIGISLRTEGLRSLVEDLRAGRQERRAA